LARANAVDAETWWWPCTTESPSTRTLATGEGAEARPARYLLGPLRRHIQALAPTAMLVTPGRCMPRCLSSKFVII
jgi:hypothetical protein